ncbi:hypothetical protein PENSPDRAFT_757294 [Peniophora sp. CONT]|nr:hypothetical protein PENSPDRAFT_757294 [Peniophora sp. CONT]
MDSDQYTKDALSSLASTVVDKAPYFGSLPLHTDAFKIYFDDKHGQARAITTANSTDEQLSVLAAACSVAPFGRGAEAVVDDTYRNAGKLDLPHFAIPFEPTTTTLAAGIKESVLDGKESKRPIRFELYKLNVYCEGGFFKAHKDTPRGATMFGSLVLVYPTTHTGGALVFRHRGREWTFDSAAAVHHDGAPAFGYAAFYSDVEHEVLPVTSEYRVTVTYNLYFDDIEDDTQPMSTSAAADDDPAFASRLGRLLDDPLFLPQGGYLGFGLRHSYPLQLTEEFYPTEKGLQHLLDMLKGADASVLRAVRAAGLSTQLRAAYDTEMDSYDYGVHDITVLTTGVMGGEMTESSLWCHLKECYNGTVLWPKGHKQYRVEREVHWVTPRAGASQVKTMMIAYGNDASLEYHYAELCLLVAVGPSGERTAKDNLTKSENEWLDSVHDEDDYDWSGVVKEGNNEEEEEQMDEEEDEEEDDNPFL